MPGQQGVDFVDGMFGDPSRNVSTSQLLRMFKAYAFRKVWREGSGLLHFSRISQHVRIPENKELFRCIRPLH